MMTTFQNYLKAVIPAIVFISISSSTFLMPSCKNENKEADIEKIEIKDENVVEIFTKNMEFQLSDTITSGWNTFRYNNLSSQTHFFLIEKYPDGKTLEDAKNYVVPYFASGMRLINEGKGEEAMAEFGKLPEWYGDVVFLGGSGLVSGGETGETMIHLTPGYYLIECYLKMSNGEFHSAMGMIDEFVVSNTDSGNEELKADAYIDISSENGIIFQDSIASGKHIFSVTFKDQMVHENFVGHDINLVKLSEGADIKALESWMNWTDPKGLIEPTPEDFTFLGGVNDMPAGSHGYFIATLEPGNYALVSEVPNTIKKNMLKTFEVYE
ncbi:MAG: hypothetical protein R2753_15295 [Chitinophagales bacterium]